MIVRGPRACLVIRDDLGWSCAAAVAVSCQQSPYELARSDDEARRSRADTLLLLLSVAEPVRQNPDAAQADASQVSQARVWIDAKRIVDVTLEIDGKPLGKFPAVRTPEVPRIHTRVATAERDSALIRADFSDARADRGGPDSRQ